MRKGGFREGAGRKPRSVTASTERVKLSMTVGELAALDEQRPKALPLSNWLRSVIFDAVFITCPKCKALTRPDGRGVNGPHVCRPAKKK